MAEKLKSAVELALERLNQSEDGAAAALSGEQKAQIGEIRNRIAAELAKLEILHKTEISALAMVPPAEAMEQRQKLQQAFVDDRARLERERDSKIERIRAQARPS
jgi:predicted deacetylase